MYLNLKYKRPVRKLRQIDISFYRQKYCESRFIFEMEFNEENF